MRRHWENLWFNRKIDEDEVEELQNAYKHYLDKRSEVMENTIFKVEDIFGGIISKDSISTEQITKPNNFPAKKFLIIKFSRKIKFFKPRKKNNIEPSAPPY